MQRIRPPVLGPLVLALGSVVGTSRPAWAQDPSPQYSSMAPLPQYLISDRNAEIALARSAAPERISHDAEVLILGEHGYETAVKGTNGFVCIVDRSWMLPYDDPEFWDPKVRLPTCMNAPAARFHVLLTKHQTGLAFSGLSQSQMLEATKTAFDKHQLPVPAPGSMCYMMSKQQNFGPKHGNADPHLMFWFPQNDHVNWGAELPGSPVDVHQYSPQPITEFAISVSKWSDGTAAPDALPGRS
jgi:hypothetical protein